MLLPLSGPLSRFPNGLNPLAESADMSDWVFQLDPARSHLYFNDFDVYAAGDWTVTTVGAASAAALAAGDGGWLALTTDTGGTDAVSLQSKVANYNLATNKDFVVKARFKLSDATDSGIVIGLATVDTTPVASLPTNGMFFYKASGAAALTAQMRSSGTATSLSVATMANDTFVTVAFVYIASLGIWAVYLNDAYVAQSSTVSNFSTAALAITIGLLNGAAAAKTLTLDYVLTAKQR
jgi:hypothetical protein